MNKQELDFAVFCIESVAEYLDMNGAEIYKLLTEKNNMLDDYIIFGYDALHTQGKEYIVNDIIEYMKKQGVLK